ncbi:MAG: hypothetical protein L6R36_007386 [Xanthoria steineri]|nr:MAG: hypothetical protein L6R36_007386 [Xanthoria steineri]
MGAGKKSKNPTSKLSAAAAPAASATQSAAKSSILRSSFAPSFFQLALFASVIQGFDTQQLRFHDTNTGRLRCEHAIAPEANFSCLDWGYYGEGYQARQLKESKMKRKRTEQVNGTKDNAHAEDVVLAFGTSESEIHLFSPTSVKTVGILKNVHSQGIRDFKFVDAGKSLRAWSIGGDGKLVQWDLRKGRSTNIISLPDHSARVLCPFGPSVLCASHRAFLIDPDLSKPSQSFTASTDVVHSMKASLAKEPDTSVPSSFLTAAETERFINVFSSVTGSLVGALVAESEVLKIAVTLDNENGSIFAASTPETDQALATINRDGLLELFESPFKFGSSSAQDSLKARMKQRTRKAKALVKVIRPDKSAAVVPLLDVDFQGDNLVLVWAEGGVDLRFDRIQWRKSDTSEVLLEGVTELVRGKDITNLGAVVMNGVKDMGKMQVDESHTVVTATGQPEYMSSVDTPGVIDVSSGEEETDYEDDQMPMESLQSVSDDGTAPEPQPPKTSIPPQDTDVTMADANVEDENAVAGGAEVEEPSFGDLIRAHATGHVDVQAQFAAPSTEAMAPTTERSLQLPSGMSLGTVLMQSLRTNDVNLLESCLHTRDKAILRATIERLDSALASTLLQKLAERFHSRPGRAGSLLVWIQWTIVAHGGYLASQPGAMKTMAVLHRVITERARSLPLLLSLKGKLDMLEAQMNLRASIKARSHDSKLAGQQDVENVIYVEGQRESDSEDSAAEDMEMAQAELNVGLDKVGGRIGSERVSESGDEDDEEMPTATNGVAAESDGEGSESGSESGLFDDEAESTERDSDDEISIDEVDHEDVDSMESEASSEGEEAPPPKRPATTKLSNGVRPKK